MPIIGNAPAGVAAPVSQWRNPYSGYNAPLTAPIGTTAAGNWWDTPTSTPGGGSGVLTGLPPTDNPSPYGQVPQVPDPGTTSLDSILSNLNNLGYISQLGGGVTKETTAESMYPLTQALPGLEGILGTLSGNQASMAHGIIPQDVITQIQQGAAERGVQTGQAPGSPNTNSAYLRALGLTSLGLENTALDNTTKLMGSIPRPKAFDPTSMMITPDVSQMWKYLASVLKAAPDPTKAASTNLSSLLAGLGRGGRGPSGPGPGAGAASDFNAFLSQAVKDQAAREAADAERAKGAQGNQPPTWAPPGGDIFSGADSSGAQVYDPSTGLFYDPEYGAMYPGSGDITPTGVNTTPSSSWDWMWEQSNPAMGTPDYPVPLPFMGGDTTDYSGDYYG